MANAIRIVLMFSGLAVALFGIGVDFLLPGTSPGVNLPQLLIIFAGLAISVFGYGLRRPALRRRLLAGSRRSILAAALVTVITLLALELLLTLGGLSVYFGSGDTYDFFPSRQLTVCGESGCRYDVEVVRDSCARGKLSGRHCRFNQQGYGDDEDFVAGVDYGDRTRILSLGDSFAHGFSADMGKSYVETIEARQPEVVVWNAAFSGAGTNQAVAAFEWLAPMLEPELTILGFYWNDFTDNLLPLQSRYDVVDYQGRVVAMRPFRFDAWDNLIQIDETTARYFAVHRIYPPANEVERILGSARLGTLVLRLRDDIAEIGKAERRLAKGIELTRGYLRQLRDLASSQNSALLVLLIPGLRDLSGERDLYDIAVDLMQELELPYMALKDIMIADEDYAPPPDGHWSNAGHQKVGALLSECIQLFIASGGGGARPGRLRKRGHALMLWWT